MRSTRVSLTLLAALLLSVAPPVARAGPRDRDGDGIPDDRDRCPDDPEDRDGFEDEDGCPDPDNDRDGIPDVQDKCPNEPETVNGYQDEDGCPDRAPVVVRPSSPGVVSLVLFAAGSVEVARTYRTLLAEIAAVMKAHPEIWQVEVQGHADDPGSDAVNERLALRRAEAVRLALTRLGVAPARLVARGYGRKQPLVKGRAEADRARNRRVGFRVVPPPPPARR